MSWLLYLLAKNPDKQEKLRTEAYQMLPEINSPISGDSYDNAQYFRACLKESLRVQSVVANNFRFTTQELVLDGYHIPINVCFENISQLHLWFLCFILYIRMPYADMCVHVATANTHQRTILSGRQIIFAREMASRSEWRECFAWCQRDGIRKSAFWLRCPRLHWTSIRRNGVVPVDHEVKIRSKLKFSL